MECFLEVTHILDLQEPVLLLGDFNGSICPGRDFMGESGGKRDTCPLLSRLLGPGGAWVDVATAVLGKTCRGFSSSWTEKAGSLQAASTWSFKRWRCSLQYEMAGILL